MIPIDQKQENTNTQTMGDHHVWKIEMQSPSIQPPSNIQNQYWNDRQVNNHIIPS